MKKNVLVVAALLTAGLMFGQRVTSMKNKNGLEILPEAGDMAIGMNAVPLLNYVGSAFGNSFTGITHPGYTSGFNQVITGKYFTAADKAFRARVGINFGSDKYTANFNYTDANTGDNKVMVVDSISKTTEIVLGAGIEMRKGYNRLQGFYGAELLLSIGSQTPTYVKEYDKALDVFSQEISGTTTPMTRDLGEKGSSAFGFGLRGFAGVEYFVLPKLSLGAEFGWGLGFASGKSISNTEIYDGTSVKTEEKEKGKLSSFHLAVDNGFGKSIFGGSAALNVIFHF